MKKTEKPLEFFLKYKKFWEKNVCQIYDIHVSRDLKVAGINKNSGANEMFKLDAFEGMKSDISDYFKQIGLNFICYHWKTVNVFNI